ncbi:helicase RepA family protein, partial [Gammaproteobacteria bacterium]|nr:helicase RepA family protein [Gammaproteobacteria bacterium]
SLQIREGSSLLFLGEESADEKARRFGGLCADLKPAERLKVTQRVRAFPAIGKDLRVTQTLAGDPHPTGFADEIIRLSLAHKEASGIELSFIVLDHTRLVMSGDPNAADDVSQLTRVLAFIANATQAVVVLIAHSPKSAMSKEGASDASEIFGSGAFTDNTRGTFVLNTMRPEEAKTYGKDEYERTDYVCLTNVKANYGKAGDTWWFHKESVPYWQIGTLVPEVMYSTKLYPEFSGLSKRLVELVESKPGKLTVSKVRGMAGKSGTLKASDREVRSAIDRMLDEGQLILEPLTKEQRAERGLSANVKEVLNLPIAG